MKVTINLISNIFLAFILALLPYTALIKLFIKNSDTPFLNLNMILIMVFNIIVYILAVIGLEIIENKTKEIGIKTHLPAALFTLMVLPILLKYIIGMVISIIPDLINYHITIIDDIILILYTIVLLIAFFKYSHKSAYFLAPLLIYHIYNIYLTF